MRNSLRKLYQKLTFLAILLVGAFLRFYRLGYYSLWKDEIFSMLEVQRPIGEIFTTKTRYFGYAPLHHFLTHLMLYFGKSEFVVRFPAAVFGIAAIYLIYKLGELLFNRKVGLVSAFLLSVSPLHIDYSREVRYYSYLVFFSVLTVFFLFRTLKEKRKRWLILFFLATFMNIMTQATSLLVLGTEVFFIVIWSVAYLIKRAAGKGKILKIIRSLRMGDLKKKENLLMTGGFLIFVLLIGVFIKSFGQLLSVVKLKPSGSPKDFVFSLLKDLSGDTPLLFFYLLFFLVGGLLGLKENKKLTVLFLLLFFVLPPAVLYFFRPTGWGFHIRYVIFIIIPYLLLIAYGIVDLLKKNYLILLTVLFFAFLTISPIRAYYAEKRGDWRGVGRYLEANVKPGDVVLTESGNYKLLLDYYWDAEKKGAISKTCAESVPSEMMRFPFKRYFLQHDGISKDRLANPEGFPMIDFEEIIPFDPDAKISPMYLFVFQPIWFWQEGEIGFFENKGWNVSDFWGQKIIATDVLASPEAIISYKIRILTDGNYDFYVNLRWDGSRGLLKYKIDNGKWSEGFQPFYGEKGNISTLLKWREKNFGTYYLKAGEHIITFINQKTPDGGRYQDIDYFYFTLKSESNRQKLQ